MSWLQWFQLGVSWAKTLPDFSKFAVIEFAHIGELWIGVGSVIADVKRQQEIAEDHEIHCLNRQVGGQRLADRRNANNHVAYVDLRPQTSVKHEAVKSRMFGADLGTNLRQFRRTRETTAYCSPVDYERVKSLINDRCNGD